MIHTIYKEIGETCLECLKRHQEQGIIPNEKATYAGRLDPLASGVMIVLSGDDVHQKQRYTACDKTYRVTVLNNYTTDTGDLLGIPSRFTNNKGDSFIERLDTYISKQTFPHNIQQQYPLFSSKTVQGKPLWWYGRENQTPLFVPSRDVTVYSLHYDTSPYRVYTPQELLESITAKIQSISLGHDFRQQKCIDAWRDLLNGEEKEAIVYCFEAYVSSGTYMRSIANRFGGTAFHIHRLEIIQDGFDIQKQN